MPPSLTLSRRLSTAASWPVGVGLASWRYLWRTVPLHRTEQAGDALADAPPPLPRGVDRRDIQHPDSGTGPLFHRRYSALIRDARLSPEDLIGTIAAEPDHAAPTEMASFIKLGDEQGGMLEGDEWLVRLPGPWDGPVRVVDRTPTSIHLVTLDGHLEAGQIRFSARPQDGMVVFEIESWARSSGFVVHLLYDHLRISKEVQLHMWTSMLERIADVSGGHITGGIVIDTRRVADHDGAAADRRLAALHGRPLNFDPEARHLEADGWRIDDYAVRLPPEPPGPPVDGGAFRIGQTLLRDYQVADPKMVRAHYDPDAPLEGRDMLLELRLLIFRTYGGCRVGTIVDEQRTVDQRPVQIWGWPYRTLEGHIEQGEMSWEIWKWLDTGDVQFRVHSYSRMAGSRNPLTAIGVWLFAQRARQRYLTTACRRMRELTIQAMRDEHPAGAQATCVTGSPDTGSVRGPSRPDRDRDRVEARSLQRIGAAALLGVVCGLRTFAGPAALAIRGRIPAPSARRVLTAAAIVEAIGDKTPTIPARTSPPALVARLVSGAACGRTLAGAVGVLAGLAGAAAGTFGARWARAALTEATGLPDPAVGLIEDSAAVAAAALATAPPPTAFKGSCPGLL